MITVEKEISLPDTYPLIRLGELPELLFFDIETTGFSGDTSQLYLIGCTYHRDGSWHLIQWFADTVSAEEELLHAFFSFLSEFSTVVHFNGDGFDIPYLLKRCQAHRLPYDFSQVESIDIYKRIRPYRKLLGLDSLKQKALERFLGVFRQDPYSGGQLIQVYQDFLMTRENTLYDMLMLHNREDLEGMPLILPILNYPDFLEHDFSLLDQQIVLRTDLFGDQQKFLKVHLESEYKLPIPISWDGFLGSQLFEASAQGSLLTLNIELFDGCLKYFYPDYQNYYYLIYEDTAVHKSVGEYVDREARKKATAKTCYSKKNGCFLPQCPAIWEPAFRKECKDKVTFAEYADSLLADPIACQTYIRSIIAIGQ